MDNNIGKKLDGRYELLELIGVGGMADIYKARDITEDKIVAAKILKNELAESEDFLRRFRNESKAIALLSHPNIVKISDVGFSDKVQFIVMEYIDGITLTEYIERQGVLKWRDVIHFITQILRALQHAHDRGIVHRDIKSQNVMLLPDGTIKVMDFGIARFNRETDKTMSEKAIGSVHYISPEQARGDATDEKSDIYSVGVMLYEMLTGKKPFDGDNPVSIALMHMQTQPKKPTDINSSIPDGLEEITLKAMQKEPAKRYQTAGEMINDIEEFKKNPSIVFEYKYFSTDQSTKYFDKVTAPIPPANKKSAGAEIVSTGNASMVKRDSGNYRDVDYDDDYYDEVVERRSPLLAILFATASVFVIIAAWLIYSIVSRTIIDTAEGDNGKEISMPNLIGMDYDEAIAQYPDLNINAEQEYSSEFLKGQITYQSVSARRSIRASQQIDIRVSKGPQLIELNNYEGGVLHIDEVTKRIKNQGFQLRTKGDESDTVPMDYVIRTEPPAGTMLEMGSVVTVWVSYGGGELMTNVPDFIGITKTRAEEHAKMYDIILIINEDYSDTVEIDRIIEQSIPPITSVPINTTVEVTVSLGPRPEKEGKISKSILSDRKGDFIFEHYIDGVLQEALTRRQNIELNKNIIWEFNNTGVHTYAIYITSVATGKRALFCEYEFDFTGPETVSKELQLNKSIFTDISKEDNVTTTAATTAGDEPEPNPEDDGGAAGESDEEQ